MSGAARPAVSGPLFLAFDLGAESGRAIAGSLGSGILELEILHRFENRPVSLRDGLYWDALGLYGGLLGGLRACRRFTARPPAGLSCDSWGVDFALLDRRGRLVANPRHYRDRFFNGFMERALEVVPAGEIWSHTGIQFMPINTLYQFWALASQERHIMDAASTMLMMADFFNFLLSGQSAQEFSLASTSQMCDPVARDWSRPLLEKFGLPLSLLPEVSASPAVSGNLRRDLAGEVGWPGEVPVISGASHDTAAAVAACPADGRTRFAYLSSGTWSLLGVEKEAPETGRKALEAGFTNEGGLGGTTRFLRNITGLWILRECRRRWALEDGRETPYRELVAAAGAEPAFRALVDVDDPSFLAPPDMVRALADFCRRTGQEVPSGRAGFVRVVLEGLALKYLRVFRELLEFVPGGRVDVLHVVGGGSLNNLLNQFTADALGVPVAAGPAEATAIGNIISQAMAVGEISSLDEGRRIVRDSFPISFHDPGDRQPWLDALGRMEAICSGD